jgi:hypothetical protein
VVSRPNDIHEAFVREDSRNRHKPSGKRLADADNVRTGSLFMLITHHSASSAESSLDLVENHQHIILRAKVAYLLQVTLWRDNYTSLSLHGFHHIGHDVFVCFESFLQSIRISVFNYLEARSERSEVGPALIIVAS